MNPQIYTNIKLLFFVVICVFSLGVFAETGREAFMTYCSNCHGSDAKGLGAHSEQTSKPPKDLSLLSQENGGSFPYIKLRNIIDGRIEKGKSRFHYNGDMPVWGKVFVAESGNSAGANLQGEAMAKMRILNIVDYLATIQEQCVGECR